MDLTRFALYTALAIVTYFMLLAWQEDYPPTIDDGSSSRVEIPQIPTAQNGQTASTDLPTDIPANPSASSANNQSDTPAIAQPAAQWSTAALIPLTLSRSTQIPSKFG